MKYFSYQIQTFIYLILLSLPFSEEISDAYGLSFTSFREGRPDHTHPSPPCDECPRKGQCVPKVSCPGHVRPRSQYPECHLKATGHVGVCCYSGSDHAAESDRKHKKFRSVSGLDLKTAHNISMTKWKEWSRKEENLLEHSRNTVVGEGTPDFGHHLSFKSADDEAIKLGKGALLNLLAAQELRNRQAIDDHELVLDISDPGEGPYCPPAISCSNPTSPYRTFNGECNNPESPSWGATNTGFERVLPPDYSDGIWALRTSKIGLPLPSARAVSSVLVPDVSNPSEDQNMLFMQFGQFIAHDVSAAIMFTLGNNSAISCCTVEGTPLPPELLHWACAPILVDPEDQFYGHYGRTCLNFVRAQLAASPDCTLGYAKQMNGATHLLDLSHLYGKTLKKVASLRAPGGLLKTFNDYGRELPPLSEKNDCMTKNERGACFASGDDHGNQIISLTAFHIIFTREHNRLARALSRLNPGWDEETVYMETRRLLQAMFQHIVYNEWLPMLLGPQIMHQFDLYPSTGYTSSYDPLVNPSVLTEFSGAALRFGHSTVNGNIRVTYPTSGALYEMVSIPEVMFQPSRMRLRHYLDRLLHGMTLQPMQKVDPFVSVGLTRYLFHGGNPYGLDLAALNIQRGRDFGIRSYNEYRKLVGLYPFTSFDELPPSASKRLSSVYSSVEDIDLWIGGLLEEHVDGGIVGPTFAHIIAEQFKRFKVGDRYYYEHGPDVNPGAFTESQLEEIKKITLARIICDNKDGVELTSMPPNAFLRADLPHNLHSPCDIPSCPIPTMDLSRFKVL